MRQAVLGNSASSPWGSSKLGQSWDPKYFDYLPRQGVPQTAAEAPHDPGRVVDKGTRDVMLEVIAAQRGKHYAASKWWQTQLDKNAQDPNAHKSPRAILGPDMGGYSEALTNINGQQELVDTMEWRLSQGDPQSWIVQNNEMDAIRSWSSSVDSVMAILDRRVAKGDVPNSSPVGPVNEPDLKDILIAASIAGFSYGLSAVL